MTRLLPLLLACTLAPAVGCLWPDREAAHAVCEIPLDALACPVIPLENIVPEEARDRPDWGCELWLRGSMQEDEIAGVGAGEGSSVDGEAVLLPPTWWSLIPDEETAISEGVASPCPPGDGEDGARGAWVHLDRAFASTYESASLVCPSNRPACPTFDDAPARRTCRVERLRGLAGGAPSDEPLALSEAVAIGSITPVGDEVAVVWYSRPLDLEPEDARQRTDLIPHVSWLRVDEDGAVAELRDQRPCETDACADHFRLHRAQLPATRAAAGDGRLLVPDLCGDGALLAVDPDGRCTPVEVSPTAEARALDIRREGGGFRLLWTNGEEMLSTPLTEDLAAAGDPVEVWSPTGFVREGPTATCRSGAPGDEPVCLLGWASATPFLGVWLVPQDLDRLRDGPEGELGWQLTGTGGSPAPGGDLGPGYALRIVTFPGTERGLALWHDATYGQLAVRWWTEPSGEIGMDAVPTQLGRGAARPDGLWTPSRLALEPIDGEVVLVAWWQAPRWGDGDGLLVGELEARALHDDGERLIVTPIELDNGGWAHSGYVVEPPALAWRNDGATTNDGRLLLAWSEPGDDEVSVEIYRPSAAAPTALGEGVRFELVADGEAVDIEESGEPVTAIDAVPARGGFAIVAATHWGVSGSLQTDEGEELDAFFLPDEVEEPGDPGDERDDIDLTPIDVRVWSAGRDAGEIWGGTELWYQGDGSADDLHRGRIDAWHLSIRGGSFVIDGEPRALWPVGDDARRVALHPSFADGDEPILAWTDMETPSVLISDLLDAEDAPEAYDDWHDVERSSLRMARLTLAGDQVVAEPLEIAPPEVRDHPPRVATSVEVPCPATPPFDARHRCDLIAYGTALEEDLEDYPAVSVEYLPAVPNGLVLADLDAGATPAWVRLEVESHWDRYLVPTGAWATQGAPASPSSGEEPADRVLVAMTSHDPYDMTSGSLWDELYEPEWASVDDRWSDSDWLDESGVATPQDRGIINWRTVALELAPSPVAPERAGAAWTRVTTDVEIPGAEECARDGSPTPSEAHVEILFDEIDYTLGPTSRAVRLRRADASSTTDGVPPLMWYWSTFSDGETWTEFAADLVTPPHMAAVGALDDGRYVVAWLETDVEWVIDPQQRQFLEEAYEPDEHRLGDCVPLLRRSEAAVGVVTCD